MTTRLASTLAALALLWAVPALAQTVVPCTTSCPARYFWEAQALTRAAPTAAPVSGQPGSGMSTVGLYGARVSLCAETAQTLSGAGALRAYYWHPGAGLWLRSAYLDLTVPAAAAGNQCFLWPDSITSVRLGGYVLFTSDSVTVSGGTTVTVRLDGQVTQ